MVLLYSTQGNNGKGTLCEIMRQLLGQRAYASISIAQSSKKFALEPLLGASAIITDENSVGEFHSDLIIQYDLTDWMNPSYTGGIVDRRCTPLLRDSYRGLLRVIPNALPSPINNAVAANNFSPPERAEGKSE